MPCEDDECASACVGEASKESLNLFQDIFSCLNETCEDAGEGEAWVACANAALNAECSDKVDICFEDRVYGTDTCSTLWNCYMPCDTSACANACVASASKDALDLLQNVFDCLNDECDPDELNDTEWNECANAALNAQCEGKVEECFDDIVYGTGSCDTLYTCYFTCDTQQCAQNCVNASSKDAIDLLNEVIGCVSATCEEFEGDDDEWEECALAILNQVDNSCDANINTCKADK